MDRLDEELVEGKETVAIERGKVEMVRMELVMSAGEVSLKGGASKLLEGTLFYNIPSMKPVVRYEDTGFRGHLLIDQSGDSSIHIGKNIRNKWELAADNNIPLDLILRMGAGESRLILGEMTLRRVEVNVGAGKMTMDLRGDPQKDYDVEVHGGVGEATIHLPTDIGVSVNARGGLGEIKTSGDLRKDGPSYVNSAYGKSGVTVRVDVQGGIGQINLHCD